MKSIFVRRAATILALPALLFLAACESQDDDGHTDMASLQVIDRGQTSRPVVATWSVNGGWEGRLPNVSLASTNQRISIGFRVFTASGEEITLSESGATSIRYSLASGAPSGIIDTGREEGTLFHGDHVYIFGVTPGATQVQFLLWHDDHADRATAPIGVTVVN